LPDEALRSWCGSSVSERSRENEAPGEASPVAASFALAPAANPSSIAAMSSPGGGQNTGSVDFGSKSDLRPSAPKNARLELVVDGKAFTCRDGTIIGLESDLAPEVFKQVPGLEARHALLGIEQGDWFILTPRNVARPLRLDGVTLPRGERRPLDKVRHHVEFDALRLGLRLSPR
jgi:hypothetical protein